MLPDKFTAGIAGAKLKGILQRGAGATPIAPSEAVPNEEQQQASVQGTTEPEQSVAAHGWQHQAGKMGFYERMAKMGVNVPESVRSRYLPPDEEM
jgi:hypothetical protein